jgi:hypothetical protein
MIAITEGAYTLAGVGVTQLALTFGIIYNARQSAAAKRVADSTNLAVNHVGPGEPTLINQVRSHGKQLVRLEKNQAWTQTVLVEMAHQTGIGVPPLPQHDDEEHPS